MLKYVIIMLVIWFFNLELNKSLTGFWLRPDVNGNTIFAYKSLITLFIKPLYDINMWNNIYILDINPYFMIICGIILSFVCEFSLSYLYDKYSL